MDRKEENNSLNQKRIARILEEAKNQDQYQYAVAGAFLNCEDMESFFSSDEQKKRRELLTKSSDHSRRLKMKKSLLRLKEFLTYVKTTDRPDRTVTGDDERLYVQIDEALAYGNGPDVISRYVAWINSTHIASTASMISRGSEVFGSDTAPLELLGMVSQGVHLGPLSSLEQSQLLLYDDNKYSETLAKLGYVTDGNIKESIEYWSTDAPFPATPSYRLSNGQGSHNVTEVFKKYLSKKLVAANPSLKPYSELLTTYTINTSASKLRPVCQRLKELSLTKF